MPKLFPNAQKQRPLTIKELATIDMFFAGAKNSDIGKQVYGYGSTGEAAARINAVLNRPLVRNEIEKRIAAQNIVLDKHLQNIDELAFNARKEDVRLRSSQDLLDRAGIHYKYFADTRPDDEISIPDDLFEDIMEDFYNRHKNKQSAAPEPK